MTVRPIQSAVRSRILGTGSYLPARLMTNADLEKRVDTTDQWIVERTGIGERRIAEESEAASDLGWAAARSALEMAAIKPEAVDLIIVATATPDRLFPSTACLIQDRLGARRAAAFDLSAACSGFLYGLSVADQYLRGGTFETVLVIGTEVLSRIVDWTDRSTCILFGDGAGAAVLRREKGNRGLLDTRLYSDGTLWDLIQVVGGGSRRLASEETAGIQTPAIRMRGGETFKAAVRLLEESAREILKDNGIQPAELDLYIPHQANIRIIQAVADRMEIPMERVGVNLDRYGNTSAASIPIVLDELVRSGRIREGSLLLIQAIGSGLTWGSAIMKW
jgi:3-oxoacyl-[acyl-carrier-protein] synthase-3